MVNAELLPEVNKSSFGRISALASNCVDTSPASANVDVAAIDPSSVKALKLGPRH
jgi:hypothetical protein